MNRQNNNILNDVKAMVQHATAADFFNNSMDYRSQTVVVGWRLIEYALLKTTTSVYNLITERMNNE